MKIQWLDLPEEHDYPAAESYLNLIFASHEVSKKILALREAKVKKFKAKDIFRASALPLLGLSNTHIKKNIGKIEAGKSLSPLLLVRGPNKLIIADGYHRLVAVYRYDEDAEISCKIV